MAEFSIVGTLMGMLGVLCLNPQHDVSTGATEGLHYLFTVLVLHRSEWRWPGGRSCGDALTGHTYGQRCPCQQSRGRVPGGGALSGCVPSPLLIQRPL